MTAPTFVRLDSAHPPFVPISPPLTGVLRPQRQAVRGRAKRNVLIIGRDRAGQELATYLKQHPTTGFVVRGFLDDSAAVGGEILGRIDDLAGVARAEFVDEVILTAPYQRELAARVVHEAQRNRLAIKVVPDLLGIDPQAVVIDKVGDLPVLGLRQEPGPVLALLLKRSADIFFSTLALILLAPALALIAVAIRLDSPGPIFYRAERVGKKGRAFLCWKFRTMIAGADRVKVTLRKQNERQGPTFKLAHDPRITRLGRFLRRYSFDELPQLWNILRGEMSLVGPRPHPLDDFERYALDHLRRLDVTPGLTGLWQVTARNDPSFHRNFELDLEYIEHWNLWLDLRILYKTIFAVLQGSGA